MNFSSDNNVSFSKRFADHLPPIWIMLVCVGLTVLFCGVMMAIAKSFDLFSHDLDIKTLFSSYLWFLILCVLTLLPIGALVYFIINALLCSAIEVMCARTKVDALDEQNVTAFEVSQEEGDHHSTKPRVTLDKSKVLALFEPSWKEGEAFVELLSKNFDKFNNKVEYGRLILAISEKNKKYLNPFFICKHSKVALQGERIVSKRILTAFYDGIGLKPPSTNPSDYEQAPLSDSLRQLFKEFVD